MEWVGSWVYSHAFVCKCVCACVYGGPAVILGDYR